MPSVAKKHFQNYCIAQVSPAEMGSLTVSGKRIAFHRVTKKIERDTMKVYETRSKCTRHDEIVRDSMKAESVPVSIIISSFPFP